MRSVDVMNAGDILLYRLDRLKSPGRAVGAA